MSEGTRRVFLTTSGIGAAIAGVAAITPAVALAARPPGTLTDAAPGLSGAEGSLVAFVRDVRSAEVSLMVGEQEIVVHDRDLVARLLGATSR